MPLTITRQDGGSGPVQPGNKVTLVASPAEATGWKWTRDGTEFAHSSNSYEWTADKTATFTVSAMVEGTQQNSEGFEVTVQAADAPKDEKSGEEKAPPEAPAAFHARFAGWVGLIAVLIVGIVVAVPVWGLWHLNDYDWQGANPGTSLAATVSVPITVVGVIALGVGIWMAVVEWRGRLVTPSQQEGLAARTRGAPDLEGVSKVIAAVGALKGAALVIVTGALLMFAAAWIASSAASTAKSPSTGTGTTTSTVATPPTAPAGSGSTTTGGSTTAP